MFEIKILSYANPYKILNPRYQEHQKSLYLKSAIGILGLRLLSRKQPKNILLTKPYYYSTLYQDSLEITKINEKIPKWLFRKI